MSGFAAAFAVAAAPLDILYGEPVRLRPQVNGAAAEMVAGGDDPDRPARDLVGIFDDEAVISRVVGSGANTHDNADVVACKSQVDFDAALFPTAADLPVQGDVLELTDRPGPPRYAIVSVQPDGVSRVVCLVTASGAAP